MHSNKSLIRLGLSLAAVAILVPLASRVNHFTSFSKCNTRSQTLQADGAPMPPLPTPKGLSAGVEVYTLVADGAPMPPLPPPKNGNSGIVSLQA
jgi:hypothetical protein